MKTKKRIMTLILAVIFLLTASAAAQADPAQPAVLMTARDEESLARDGEIVLLKFHFDRPTVIIDGNPDATAKINTVFIAMENELAGSCAEILLQQDGYLEEAISGGTEWPSWMVYEVRKDITVSRADSSVISFGMVDYSYAGGAHGMYTITGISFDTQSGEQLVLADLSDDPEGFREACVREIMVLCEGEELWMTDEESLRTAIEVIVDRESWYLTDEGIIFHSDPYELAPYARGAIEFLIPYVSLPPMKY